MVYNSNITAVTGNTTLSTKGDVYLVDATSGNLTITLPSIIGDGMQYKIKRTDGVTTSTVTLIGTGGQTIDGLTSTTILPLSVAEVQSYNSAWYLISNFAISRSGAKALFTSAFIQNNGTPSVQFSGSNNPQTICYFYYPGSSSETITSISVVLSTGGGTPSGTIVIQTLAATTIATINYSSLTLTPAIFSTSTISNLPSSTSALNLIINIGTPSTNKVNVHAVTVQ